MSDIAVDFPLGILNKLLVYHSSDLIDVKSVQRDLLFFKAFLKAQQRRKNKLAEVTATPIHDIAYELEDVLEVFLCQEKATSLLSRLRMPKKTLNLQNICRGVNYVRYEVERCWSDVHKLETMYQHRIFEDQPPRPAQRENVVGFVDVRKDLIRRLTEDTDYFDVVSLIGMHGLGKTTVALNIFHDPQIRDKFHVRIWLHISEDFSEKAIFLEMLTHFTTITNEVSHRHDREIAKIVADYLRSCSFLIVLDYAPNPTDWNRLRIAIPKANTKGKILITSSDYEVGYYASYPRPPVKLRFLTQEESWELLQFETFGKLNFPAELEIVGQQIARKCEGLPLSIVTIGGILVKRRTTSDTRAMTRMWKNVSENVSKYITEHRLSIGIMRLSYEKLPYNLRACSLYLGVFPRDYEIPVSKLIRMWIGEGFIQRKLGHSLEEIAYTYLVELINRNMVIVDKLKSDGEVKTCKIHDTFREFFLIQSEVEKFLQDIKGTGPNTVTYCHRVSIHSNWLEFISSKRFCPCVRTFVSFSKEKHDVTLEKSSNIIGAFKVLRVLEVFPFTFTKTDSKFYKLLHLRYIALSSNWSILSSKFNMFWNIQTLIVHTTSPTLEIKADILKMRHLRHFKTNAIAILPKPSPGSRHGAELQTLGTISAESCTAKLCERAPNLKKLGIRGRLALLLERRIGSIDSLGNMEHLRKLKLINDVYPKPAIEGRLHRLPLYDQFPSGLTSLTLCGTFLSWDHMYTVGLLQKLMVLKLKDNAFIGDTWEVQCGGFQDLEYLHIELTELAFWIASTLSYPKLTTLVLRNCEKLCGIPIEFADIPTLQMLELHCCPSAAESATKISEAKQKASAGGPEFKFSIIPPME